MIHPSAIVHPSAHIHPSASIGAFSIIDEDVVIDENVKIAAHVVVKGHTHLCHSVEISSFACVGFPPQDLKYVGEPGRLTVGANTRIREHATIHIGTQGGGMLTSIGENVFIMGGAHVAHDCHIGHGVILAHHATLGGHVIIGEKTIIGGLAAIHQFVQIGHNAMISGTSGVTEDVIPYAVVTKSSGYLMGLNLVGMRRQGLSNESIKRLQTAYYHIFETTEGTLSQRLDALPIEIQKDSHVQKIIQFIHARSHRPLCMPFRNK